MIYLPSRPGLLEPTRKTTRETGLYGVISASPIRHQRSAAFVRSVRVFPGKSRAILHSTLCDDGRAGCVAPRP
jgi:hypothetical protein